MAIVTIVPRQYHVESVHQVIVAAGPGFDHSYTGGCMRHEHVEQAITFGCDEAIGLHGEIEDTSSVPRLDRENLSVHSRSSDVLALKDLAHRSIREDCADRAGENWPDGEHGDLAD